MILTPAEPKPPEKPIRVLAKNIREQLTKEWEDKKLESGVHVQWDSIDMAERIFELTMESVWAASNFDISELASKQDIVEVMYHLAKKGWRSE
jgi:hypothetical protein